MNFPELFLHPLAQQIRQSGLKERFAENKSACKNKHGIAGKSLQGFRGGGNTCQD